MSDTADTRTEQQGAASYVPLLLVCMLGMFLAILNQTVLNVAIPQLMNDFSVSANTAQWLMTGYMLVNGVLIPISAYLIETFGTRKLFMSALICFMVGSLLCGIAPNFATILIGRLVQAVGAGVMMPLVLNVILFIFPPHIRGKGMGLMGIGMVFAPAIGPTLSGWVIEEFSWRLMFDGMVVLALLAIGFGWLFMKDVGTRREIPFDLWGMILSIVGFGGLLYAFSEAGNSGWSSLEVVIALVVGGFTLVLFILRQLSVETPLLDFRVFKYDMFTLSTVINGIVTMALYAGMFLLPIYLQNLRGFTPLESGLLLLPGAIVMGLMSPISGALFDRFGPRPLAIVGLIVTTVCTWEFTEITLETSYWTVILIYTIRAFGMSLLMMPIMTAGLNQLPEEANSYGNAMANTMRQVAGSIGTALLTTVYTNRMSLHTEKLSEGMNPFDTGFYQSFSEGVRNFAQSVGLPVEQARELFTSQLIGDMATQAAVMGINDAFFWATAFTVISLFLCLFLRDVRKDKKPDMEEPTKEVVAS
ncbi:MAG: DHA2 family efflux MFS transporter permease subunit [Firmicutes bacterium]|uniref:Drug resistance transporter, EmrB/QacA subfamily n=1 Tax=Melghirimyces thermohalophilus TaxID=1236220 RepID=A0A1G6KA66_9BACL|nr:DHA2 family efflux MFS transporter permease subunit [Melghirimyces thermohalophilus]MDA8354102.1 DHA2 family efflux MFS transporter permease subunit [Bacillota bacterium]SDC27817.1 drug resistance transporter, EmrB/QacA subfamily [Melghirimyces thermohalophilus]